MRVCKDGRAMATHLRWASEVRGTLSVRQENDEQRHRAVLVARLTPTDGKAAIPPLYDVTLLHVGDAWSLAGFERLITPPLGQEASVAQTWHAKPAEIQDLERAENEWRRLARRVTELEEELARRQAR